jgi:2-polyprenyl-6-methoxyphenol hydroxylase-like FAD-dependent oxidoreductase
MNKNREILIIGAGPSGLSLAIFLSDLGYSPRIIDKKPNISEYSKALAVNPRTLEIFDKYNVTEKILANGRKLCAVNIWKGEKTVFRNDFSKAKHKYPFLIIQPQKESEELLRNEVEARKIKVEYGTQFDSFEKNENGFSTKFANGNDEVFNSGNIIGADGAHSMVRKQLGVQFKGFRYAETWELYDVELSTNLNPDEAHIQVFNNGGMIMIRIKDNLWRVAGNLKNLFNYLPKNSVTGKIAWESKFNITHNIAETLVKDNVVLIGDAAHLHSPIGGRGMNLGIEDAYIVSKLINENRLFEYEALRKKYLHKTVNRINDLTQFVAGHSFTSRFMRNNIGMFRPFFPLIKPIARNFALGIDNPEMQYR